MIFTEIAERKYVPNRSRHETATSSIPFLPICENDAIHHFEPDVDMDFVLRLLGSKNGAQVTSCATQSRINVNKKKAFGLISPRLIAGTYGITNISKDHINLAGGIEFKSRKLARYLEGASMCVVLAGTVGRHIDTEINRLLKKKQLADAYILDAMGSGAVESLVERFHQETAKTLLPYNCIPGLRFSPGYCDWPITEQHKLFSLLTPEKIDMQLETSGLMQPRKSISAVFGIFNQLHAKEVSDKTPCLRCAKKNCIARRSPAHAEAL